MHATPESRPSSFNRRKADPTRNSRCSTSISFWFETSSLSAGISSKYDIASLAWPKSRNLHAMSNNSSAIIWGSESPKRFFWSAISLSKQRFAFATEPFSRYFSPSTKRSDVANSDRSRATKEVADVATPDVETRSPPSSSSASSCSSSTIGAGSLANLRSS